jgi:uncharacterized protein YjbJ (UPF0337 family)
MISQIYRSLLTISLISFFSFAIIFGLAVDNSWAAPPLTQLISSIHPQIASMNEIKAVAKDIEGKTQEAIGNVTGDRKNQIIGKAKQAEAKASSMTEEVINKAKDVKKLMTK